MVKVERLLPPRLGALLALEADVAFAERLRRVLEAGARAIGKLAELDLIQYEEDDAADSTADLALWEQVAPLVASTIADVNGLLNEVATQFPAGGPSFSHQQTRVDQTLQQGIKELREAVFAFGQRVRDPQVVGDKWNLMDELQRFRFRFRDRIGQLVYETALRLGDCRRYEVDPGYEDELAAALVVRSTTADLRRLMHVRIQKVSEAPAEDVEWNARQVEKELNAFGRTAAWRALRAHDKRSILEFRGNLKRLLAGQISKVELLELVEPFVEFVDEFAGVNQREVVVHHDQEALASVGVALERASNASNPDAVAAAFGEALNQAQSLYGRDPEFDGFLRRLRKGPVPRSAIPEELESFFSHLANLSSAL